MHNILEKKSASIFRAKDTTQHNNPKDHYLHSDPCGDFKSYKSED
jgi:hypothetical protein